MQDYPLWQLGNQWHLQKKWNSFLDPRALRQNLHFQTSEYRYVNISRGILGGTFRALLGTLFGALLGALWGALWMALWGHYGRHFGGTLEGTFGGTFGDDLGPQALHQSLYFQSKCQILGHFGGHFFKANFWGNLETNDIYKKSGTVFWTPKHYVRVCISNHQSTGMSIFWGALWGALLGAPFGSTFGGTWKPMTFTKKKDQFFGPLSTTSESAFPRVPVSQYFGGHFWGHFWGTFGDNLGPQAQLGNQWHLQKKWNSFLDPPSTTSESAFPIISEPVCQNFWGHF